jgi:hypothetical protein
VAIAKTLMQRVAMNMTVMGRPDARGAESAANDAGNALDGEFQRKKDE